MIPQPRATIVVITRDRRDELLATLAHTVDLPDTCPVIVVDNASRDGTGDAVASRFPQVTLIRANRNLGSLGRNLAVSRVTTPYVVFCDDDTHWQAGAIDRAVKLLDTHPGLATVTGRCLVAPGLAEDPITPELRYSPVPGPDWLPGPALMGIMAGLTVFRVSAFRAVGGFHARLWFGGEEELLALDLAAAGWWMCWAEDVIVHHLPSTRRDSTERRRLGIRNTLWTSWLRRPAGVAVRHSARVVRSAPRDADTARATAAALAGLPWVLASRRVLRPHVERRVRSLEASQRASVARRYVG
ncbi:GT2 family glycosyltransferase [Stackebrandtia albiflava]|uniref:GT2 family glycosyltransferase n=1 Tax=Stackebrandtia albiflava TaxID=406432 RepID=A0A562VA07_9ACTN|nr:glycosyltransferase [Stackebrandtia albiflava]TWJ14716.1 GT2 family glycosyltransferase [Stackebrandtia albiflava]